MSDSIFEKGLNLKVGSHVEKKGKFSYLSWAWAVQELRKLDPKATWEVVPYCDYENNEKGLLVAQTKPYMKTDCGYFVKVIVTLSDGTSFPQIHPVLDNSNKPVSSPNAFQINTSIQRCLTKAIALASGIGLALYAGEDLPTEQKEEKKEPERNWIKEIQTTTTLDELQSVFTEAYKATSGTEQGKLVMEKDKQKVKLKGE